jgi:pyruvate kinase
MLDLPIPNRKPRIILNDDKLETLLRAGEIFRISPQLDATSSEINYVDDKEILNRLTEGVIINYSDGECRFTVFEINKSQEVISLKAENDCKIFTRKSISYGYTISDIALESIFFQIIDSIIPESIAFSFIDSATNLLDYKKKIKNKNIDIISKIETREAVCNIEDILKTSNVMLARGDLLLNSDPIDFYMLHNSIVDKANKSDKRLYIATGILPTLSYRYLPTHSELVDLGVIIKANPFAIILNADVVQGEYIDNAINIIRNLKIN